MIYSPASIQSTPQFPPHARTDVAEFKTRYYKGSIDPS